MAADKIVGELFIVHFITCYKRIINSQLQVRNSIYWIDCFNPNFFFIKECKRKYVYLYSDVAQYSMNHTRFPLHKSAFASYEELQTLKKV